MQQLILGMLRDLILQSRDFQLVTLDATDLPISQKPPRSRKKQDTVL